MSSVSCRLLRCNERKGSRGQAREAGGARKDGAIRRSEGVIGVGREELPL